MKFLIFDTETVGLPKYFNQTISAGDNWPRMIELSAILWDSDSDFHDKKTWLVKPDGFDIPEEATKINGITNQLAQKEGKPLIDILNDFYENFLHKADSIVCHNVQFDKSVVGSELLRMSMRYEAAILQNIKSYDTCEGTINICKIPHKDSSKKGFKRPKMIELYRFCFGKDFDYAHTASADTDACFECFKYLVSNNLIKVH